MLPPCVAAAVALGAGAVTAAIPSASGTISGCYARNGAWRLVESSAHAYGHDKSCSRRRRGASMPGPASPASGRPAKFGGSPLMTGARQVLIIRNGSPRVVDRLRGVSSFCVRWNRSRASGRVPRSVWTMVLVICWSVVIAGPAYAASPVANPDQYSVQRNTTLSVPAPGVLANDTDPEGDPIVATGFFSGPSHGTVTLSPDGALTYTPNPGPSFGCAGR